MTPPKVVEFEKDDNFTYGNRRIKFVDNSHIPIQKLQTIYNDEVKNEYIRNNEAEGKRWRKQKAAFEEVMMVKELDVHQISYEWYIIKTSSTFYQIWKFIIVIMSFVTSFTYAYFAAFLDLMDEDEINSF